MHPCGVWTAETSDNPLRCMYTPNTLASAAAAAPAAAVAAAAAAPRAAAEEAAAAAIARRQPQPATSKTLNPKP